MTELLRVCLCENAESGIGMRVHWIEGKTRSGDHGNTGRSCMRMRRGVESGSGVNGMSGCVVSIRMVSGGDGSLGRARNLSGV